MCLLMLLRTLFGPHLPATLFNRCSRSTFSVAYLVIMSACVVCMLVYRVAQKFGTVILYALTLPNINRFSKLFHYQNQEKIGNNTVRFCLPSGPLNN